MLTREELETSYLNHVTQAHNHLDAARTSKSSIAKGFHIAQALTMAQLATAAATALAQPETGAEMRARVQRVAKLAAEGVHSFDDVSDHLLGGQDR